MNGVYLYFANKLFLVGHYWDFKVGTLCSMLLSCLLLGHMHYVMVSINKITSENVSMTIELSQNQNNGSLMLIAF